MKYLFYILLAITTSFGNEANVVVFMYHHFGESKYPSTNTRLEQFQNHLDYLDKNNYHVWPLSKVIHYVKNKYSLPDKTVSLTIDDAYITIYKHAYPMLKEKGYPFTVFVNTNAIGEKSIQYMSWNHMREMKTHGAEFLNHSHTHAYLVAKGEQTKEESQIQIKFELESAQAILQKELGSGTNERPKLLSYPFGEFTQDSATYIESLGYVGVGQISGVVGYNTDLKRVPRFAMAEKFANMESFVLKLNTVALPLKSTAPWDTKVIQNPPKLTIELKKPIKKLGCYTSNGKRINVKWLSSTRFEVQATKPLSGPRDRYTCTAPSNNGKWYWYSHLWILD
ncbi:polysaccharide deacetylase family protein [Sulfurimonas sp. SAG-AH-194-I05]|nr:polysaccharide deacetylase family protein [Sulfurimonas sp. SAG-AH-194-I05]MDF1876064.1 polysaccharide deacetylase family protein [Sulfurimonas sp. SAG-AH-194-I05]